MEPSLGTSCLEVSCSFLVYLANSRVFAVNNIFEIQNFILFGEEEGKERTKKISRGPRPPRAALERTLHLHFSK